ncbi:MULTISPECIES: HNH endonuclease [Aurantimonas]|nr:HNH endonuclease [Aurantimonas coralicida]
MSDQKVDQLQRAGRLWLILVRTAKAETSVTYKQAADEIGIHWRPMAYVLGPIQDYCQSEGYPRLTALVHNKASGVQGGGYLGVPGDQTDLEEIYQFDWDNLENPFSIRKQEDLNKIASELLQEPNTAPDKWVATLSRGDVQRVFRSAILEAYGYRCAVCSIGFTEILEAAHIVPWASGQRKLRADPRNGICLCANHHRLFDAGWLQIGPDRIVRFSDPDMECGGYEPIDEAAVMSLHGSRLKLPENEDLWPDAELLRGRQA